MGLDDMIMIVERIDIGRLDHWTSEPRYAPLWQHPFLRESFLRLLQAYQCGHGIEFEQHNFENICALFAPEFETVLDSIDRTPLDLIEMDSISFQASRAP